MLLSKSLAKLFAVGCTSAGLVGLWSSAVQAASFNFSYMFDDGTTFSALLDGELAADGNILSVTDVQSSSLTNTSGMPVDFSPTGLAFNSTLALDGGFASFAVGDLAADHQGEVGFSLFNTAERFFADASYVVIDVPTRTAEEFRFSGYSLTSNEPQPVPEPGATSALLMGLAGMSVAVSNGWGMKRMA